jgi:HSP20 family molecular chaperone IbpA
MISDFEKFLKKPVNITVLALSIGLVFGLGALTGVQAIEKSDTNEKDQGTPIRVQKGESRKPMQRFDLDSTINKMRESSPKLSLPSSMFEPWWQTMLHDPDSDWLLRNFDIMSSDHDKRWAFPLGSGAYIPRVDVDTTDKSVKLSAEVPGIEEKNLDVKVTDTSVSIKGEKQAEESQKSGTGFQSVERHYGSFERTVILPCKVNSEKAEAHLKNGVLSIVIPKAETVANEGKKLTIRSD